MRIDASKWFGLTLLAGLFFLWCLVSVIETGTASAGWVWGLVVFGLITLLAGAMALIVFLTSGQRFNRADVLTRVEPSAPPRLGHGRGLEGGAQRLMGHGEAPRRASGRDIVR